jgi:PAS domain S-box-containing protein
MTDGLLVLLALSSPNACRRLRSALRERGYRVITAQTGREAVRHLCTLVPAAIVTDWELTDLPAGEMQTILRAMCPAAARLVLAAQPSLEGAVAALEEGALAYLPMDVDALTLLGRLRTAVERRPEVLGDTALQGALRRAVAEAGMYRSALHHASDLLSAIDAHYRYLFANQAFLAYHGRRMEDVVGREVGEVLGDARFLSARPALDRALAGAVGHHEAPCVHPALGERLLCVTCHPLRGTDGAVTAALSVARDVTGEKLPAFLEYAADARAS